MVAFCRRNPGEMNTKIRVGVMLVLAVCVVSLAQARQSGTKKVVNGMFAVLAEGATLEEVTKQSGKGRILLYDGKYVDSSQIASPHFVAVDTTLYVPLVLEGSPDAKKDGRGHTMLSVSLSKQYVGRLSDFTRKHLGGRVAIVLGGEVITMHTVRSVIEGGKLQITRCYDDACDVLLSKLVQ
jgi:preprotein translocase subunit SecD